MAMLSKATLGQNIGARLINAGIIPPQTSSVEISLKVDEPVSIRIEAYLDRAQFDEVIGMTVDNQEHFVKRILLRPNDGGNDKPIEVII